jgi:hypothetical protein
MQTTMLIAQNSVQRKDLGVASSAAMFFRSIGGSFGVSLFGAVFNHQLAAELAARLGPRAGSVTAGGRTDPSALRRLPAAVRLPFLDSLAGAVAHVFGWAILFAALIPVAAFFVRQIPLRAADPQEPTPALAEEVAAQDCAENQLIAAMIES